MGREEPFGNQVGNRVPFRSSPNLHLTGHIYDMMDLNRRKDRCNEPNKSICRKREMLSVSTSKKIKSTNIRKEKEPTEG